MVRPRLLLEGGPARRWLAKERKVAIGRKYDTGLISRNEVSAD
jgi:hypothetical protein